MCISGGGGGDFVNGPSKWFLIGVVGFLMFLLSFPEKGVEYIQNISKYFNKIILKSYSVGHL